MRQLLRSRFLDYRLQRLYRAVAAPCQFLSASPRDLPQGYLGRRSVASQYSEASPTSEGGATGHRCHLSVLALLRRIRSEEQRSNRTIHLDSCENLNSNQCPVFVTQQLACFIGIRSIR